MRWPLLVTIVVLLASCGPGQPTYLDRVRALPTDPTDPRVQEVAGLLEHPEDRNPDDLMRTWKEFLGDASLPLRQDSVFTFVYYDFTKTLKRVYLEASFAPGRREALHRVGDTALFYRNYDIPRPERVRYRFSDGTTALVDPFHSDVAPGSELWQLLVEPPDPAITEQKVLGVSEALLNGQDLKTALPPFYRRNLGWTYPLVVVVGLDGDAWTRPFAQLMEQNAIRPVVAVSVGSQGGTPWTAANLKAVLENRVVPWIRSRYRVSILPSDLYLVGWGTSAKAVQDVAASRTDFWTRTWIPPATAASGEDAWNSQAQGWLRSQFPTVNP